MNEVGLNAKWLKKDLTHKETQEFTKKVLNHMRERLSDYQEKYGDLYNLEATPAESTSYRLAKHDKKKFPQIISASTDEQTPYYTNSSHLPVSFTSDIFEALDIQDELQTLYTSGTVFHAFLGEKLPDWKATAKLVRTIAENYKLPYYTISPTYSVCAEHGYIAGEQKECPVCGKSCEIYSRITGYYRPVQNWNDGKSQEFKERKTYDVNSSKQKCCTCNEEKLLLFTTKTCPNCLIAKSLLNGANIKYEMIDAMEHMDLAKKYGIMQAPTLVKISGDEVKKYINITSIKAYIEG